MSRYCRGSWRLQAGEARQGWGVGAHGGRGRGGAGGGGAFGEAKQLAIRATPSKSQHSNSSSQQRRCSHLSSSIVEMV
jgi:hypothetical protein